MINRWLLVGERESREQKGVPKAGDLVCMLGQSPTKPEFAPFGNCSARIKSVDEKNGTFVLEYVTIKMDQPFEGVSLSQLLPLDPFDPVEFANQQAREKKIKQEKGRIAREKRKEKVRAKQQLPEQLKEMNKARGAGDVD
jgi:hypothetical protein